MSPLSFLTRPGRVRNRRRNPLWRFRRALFLVAILGLSSLVAGVAILSREELQPLAELDSLAQTSYLCTADVVAGCGPDSATARFTAGEDRVIVTYDQIPRVLIDAVVATEDGDFFEHDGVDPLGIARAAYRDIRNEGVQQGGSTITQQLVKIEQLTPERTITRKLKEATLAIKLERELSKEEILTRYLNIIYFGRGAYGIEAAARAYFGTTTGDLDLAQSAFLAGLIRAPSTADPANDPIEAARRRSTTLDLMVREEMITQAQADEANARDWSDVVGRDTEGLGEIRGAPGTEYWVEAVRRQLEAIELPDGNAYTGGYRIYTTLDPRLQQAAVTAIREEDFGRDDGPAASIVAIDDRGFVRAMVGGEDFDTSQVNLALGRDGGGSGRQPGSSFKPFALAEALEQGISSRSYFSAPSVIEIPEANDGQTWTVRGGGSSEGYRDLIDALRVSSNVVYAQLMVEVGPRSVVEMANRLGVSAELPTVNALVLGSGEVSVLDMAASYSTLANQGTRYDPIFIERIERADGTVVCWYPVDGVCESSEGRAGEKALDADLANQVTAAMRSVVDSGTGRGAAVDGVAIAGKTGTTQDARDAWFVGYTCDLTAAVWMGYVGAPGEPVRTMQNYRGLDEVHGGDIPAPIFGRFMELALQIGDPELVSGCADFPVAPSGGGIQLNLELSTTTLPECQPLDTTTSIVEGEDGATSVITEPVPTTEPCEPPTTLEGEGAGEDGAEADPGESTTGDSTPPGDGGGADGDPGQDAAGSGDGGSGDGGSGDGGSGDGGGGDGASGDGSGDGGSTTTAPADQGGDTTEGG